MLALVMALGLDVHQVPDEGQAQMLAGSLTKSSVVNPCDFLFEDAYRRTEGI